LYNLPELAHARLKVYSNSPAHTFFARNSPDSLEGASERRRHRGLHTDLDRFEGAKTNIGNELGGGRSGQVKSRLVLLGSFFAGQLTVEVLEVFVEAVFARSLHRVPKEGRAEASEDTAEPFSPCNDSPGLEIALVELGIDLATAFDKIEGSDCSVCNTLASGQSQRHDDQTECDLRMLEFLQRYTQHSIWQSRARCLQP
jgi:hypothetical protein